MEQITRAVVRGVAVRVGVDLAKRVIQVHAVDGAGKVLTSRALARDKFVAWCEPHRVSRRPVGLSQTGVV